MYQSLSDCMGTRKRLRERKGLGKSGFEVTIIEVRYIGDLFY